MHDQAHGFSEGYNVPFSYIDAINQDLALGYIVEPENQCDGSRFSASGLSNKGDGLVLGDLHVQAPEDPVILAGGIAEPDILELNLTLENLRLDLLLPSLGLHGIDF